MGWEYQYSEVNPQHCVNGKDAAEKFAAKLTEEGKKNWRAVFFFELPFQAIMERKIPEPPTSDKPQSAERKHSLADADFDYGFPAPR